MLKKVSLALAFQINQIIVFFPLWWQSSYRKFPRVVLYKFWSKLHANSCFANFFKNRTRKQTNMLKHFLHQASVRLGKTARIKTFFFNIGMLFIQGDIWHYITSDSEILPLFNYLYLLLTSLSVDLPSKKVITLAWYINNLNLLKIWLGIKILWFY